jgi:hypothetical protein
LGLAIETNKESEKKTQQDKPAGLKLEGFKETITTNEIPLSTVLLVLSKYKQHNWPFVLSGFNTASTFDSNISLRQWVIKSVLPPGNAKCNL